MPRSRPSRPAALDKADNALTQIKRIGLRASRITSSQKRISKSPQPGIPFSIQSENPAL